MPATLFFHTPEIFPPMDFFFGLLNSDTWVVIDHVTFVARSRESRCRVRSADGGIELLPVIVKRPCNKKVCSTVINSSEPWRSHFLKRLRINYWDTPFFNEYYPDVKSFTDSPHVLLETFTLKTTLWVADLMGKPVHCIRTCEKYVNEPVSQIMPEMLAELNGKIFDEPFVHPIYPQRTDPFEPDLSILDALFCIGAENIYTLLSNSLKKP